MDLPNEEERAAILEHPDVQKVMWIISDLLTGKKRLAIKSHRLPSGNAPGSDYKHTFLIEDIEDGA